MASRILTLLLFLVFLPWSEAQTLTMTGSIGNIQNTLTPVSSVPICSASLNCVHDFLQSPVALTGGATTGASDGSVYFMDVNRNIYSVDFMGNTGNFTKLTQYGTSMQQIAFAALNQPGQENGQSWGISNTQGSCASGHADMYLWNGTAWQGAFGCVLVQAGISVAANNSGVIVDSTGYQVNFWSGPSNAWTVFAPVPGTGNVTGVRVSADGLRVDAVRNGIPYANTLSKDPGGTWSGWSALPGSPSGYTITTSYPVNDPFLGSTHYALGDNRYGVYAAFALYNGAWTEIAINLRRAEVGFAFGTMFVTDFRTSNNYAAALSLGAVQWKHHFEVHTTCNPSPCPATVHTMHSVLTLGGVSAPEQYLSGQTANEVDKMDATATFDGFSNGDAGDGSVDNVDCPVAGPNFVNGGKTVYVVNSWIAHTYGKWTGGASSAWGNYDGIAVSLYPVGASCSNIPVGETPDFLFFARAGIPANKLADLTSVGTSLLGPGPTQMGGWLAYDKCFAEFDPISGNIVTGSEACFPPNQPPEPPYYTPEGDAGHALQKLVPNDEMPGDCTLTVTNPVTIFAKAEDLDPKKPVYAEKNSDALPVHQAGGTHVHQLQ